MQRTFATARLAFSLAVCASPLLIASTASADSQLLDPGWELAYSGQSNSPGGGGSAGGVIEYVFGDEVAQPVIQRPYQPAPVYRQQAPAQPPRGYQTAPAYYQQAPAQPPRGYQPAPASYQQVPAQPRGLFQQWFSSQTVPAQQSASQQAPGNYQQVPPQQQEAYQPTLQNDQTTPLQAPGYAPSGQGDMAHAPIDPKYDRREVDYLGDEQPGTIVIDTPHYFLYLVEGGGKAVRYGIGVGRPGFTWAGVKEISAMREWPDWYPPVEMLQRRPDLPRYMPGGPNNPLGARALYLGSTLYRIHGSNEPWTIGTQVSSGCIRLRNEDVIDLYGRVKVGTKVVVI